jgi:hypothetical protein
MKIGYLRQGMNIFLTQDYKGSSGGSWEERHAFFLGAAARGHQVEILSPISLKQIPYLFCQECGPDATGHYPPLYKNVTYNPNCGKIPEDIDVLFIEGGADNYTYRGAWGFLPSIVLLHYMLKDYKGLVFYSLSDGTLPPALIPEAYPVNTAYKYLEASASGDIFRDKGWVFLGKGTNPEYLRTYMSGNRHPIAELNLPIDYWEPGCYLEDRRMLPAKTPKYTLLYTGNQRGRKQILRKWYCGYPEDIDVSVIGNWGKDNSGLDTLGLKMLGPMSNENVTFNLNDALAQVYITDENYFQSGMIASRFFEVIYSGCTLWIPRELSSLFKNRMDEFYVVDSPEQFVDVLRQLQSMSWAERVDLNEEQVSWIVEYTPERRMIELEAIVEKYRDLPKTQFEEILPSLQEHIKKLVTVIKGDDEKSAAIKRERMRALSGRYDFKKCVATDPPDVDFPEDEINEFSWFKQQYDFGG